MGGQRGIAINQNRGHTAVGGQRGRGGYINTMLFLFFQPEDIQELVLEKINYFLEKYMGIKDSELGKNYLYYVLLTCTNTPVI